MYPMVCMSDADAVNLCQLYMNLLYLFCDHRIKRIAPALNICYNKNK